MTANKNTAVPGTSKKRNSKGAIAVSLGLAALVAIGGPAIVNGTLAAMMDKGIIQSPITTNILQGDFPENVAFDITPGVDATPQFITVTNSSGDGVLAAAGFAPNAFTPVIPAALNDTEVRVWNVTTEGKDKPWANANGETGLFWKGTLAEFLDTSFVADRALAPGASQEFAVLMSTPYDVNPNEWSPAVAGTNRAVQPVTLTGLVVHAQTVGEESILKNGTTLDGASGMRLGAASLVRDAAATINDAPASTVAWNDDYDTIPGSVIRAFYTDPSFTTGLGTVLLDASKNDGEDGRVINDDYDGDGVHLSATGVVIGG